MSKEPNFLPMCWPRPAGWSPGEHATIGVRQTTTGQWAKKGPVVLVVFRTVLPSFPKATPIVPTLQKQMCKLFVLCPYVQRPTVPCPEIIHLDGLRAYRKLAPTRLCGRWHRQECLCYARIRRLVDDPS